MSRHGRSVSRVRTRSACSRSAAMVDESLGSQIDLSEVDPEQMLHRLVAIGALDPNAVVPGSNVPLAQSPDATTHSILAGLEMLIQRSLVQHPPVAPPQPAPTATPAMASGTASSGKPPLMFPDPPMYEGDPVKLDGWLTQTHMYLRAYDVDLSTSRSVEIATMFLRGRAQDWWTGQFHLQATGAVASFGTWDSLKKALIEAFRPVELH